MTKKELATQYHEKGFNCCQAVACAFAEEAGVDMETIFAAAEGFGLGMGGMQATCGALSGAVMIAGFKNSCANPDQPTSKADTYKITREMVKRFEEKTGSTVCKELKGVETGKMLCSCRDCVCCGVEVVEELL